MTSELIAFFPGKGSCWVPGKGPGPRIRARALSRDGD
jgi:hypothetical protein